MLKEYDNRIPTDISEYRDGLELAFSRLEIFSHMAKLPIRQLEGKSVIDIGGGMIGNNYDDGSTFSEPQFFPFFPVICSVLGMKAVNLDRANQKNDKYLQSSRLESFFTHIPVNLAKCLHNPEDLYGTVKSKVPWTVGNTFLVNSVNLITLRHGSNSPGFLHSLGVSRDFFGEPINNSKNNDVMMNAVSGVFAFSHLVLNNNGYLFFNDKLYEKVGRNLKYIPANSQKDTLSVLNKMVGKPALGVIDNNTPNDGNLYVDQNINFKLNGNIWKMTEVYNNDLFPLP